MRIALFAALCALACATPPKVEPGPEKATASPAMTEKLAEAAPPQAEAAPRPAPQTETVVLSTAAPDAGVEQASAPVKVVLTEKPASASAPKAEADGRPAVDPGASAQEIWNTRCAGCHGKDGSAQTKVGRAEKVEDFRSAGFQKDSDAKIAKAISDGRPNTKMKAYGEKMTAQQLAGLVKLIRAMKP